MSLLLRRQFFGIDGAQIIDGGQNEREQSSVSHWW